MRQILKLLVVCCYCATAAAEIDVTKEDLPFLPKFCSGTQIIRYISKDRVPIETYIRLYGDEYNHLHHYCWALLEEIKAAGAPEKSTGNIESRIGYLQRSKRDLEYSIYRSADDFVLLPEILVTYARVVNSLGMRKQAIETLERAVSIRPEYSPAALKLSEMYLMAGDRDKAVRVLEDGLEAAPGTALIIDKLQALGAEPDPRYLKPVRDRGSHEAEGSTVSASDVQSGEDSAAVTDQDASKSNAYGNGDNPYCRFCAD